jgi:hypothetical protein
MADESLAGVYEILKRHEETLRDLVVEVRLLYYTLPEKDRLGLERSRPRTTSEVGELFADKVRTLEAKIKALRGS